MAKRERSRTFKTGAAAVKWLAGERRSDLAGPMRLMGVCESWAMVRRRGCMPSVMPLVEWLRLPEVPDAS